MAVPVVNFTYRNHRGEVAERTVTVDAVEFKRNVGYGYKDGWFVSGYCHDKKARRSFALCNIIPPEPNRATQHASFVLMGF
jgi:predicted DNA-binding transcriptional regulator YafY